MDLYSKIFKLDEQGKPVLVSSKQIPSISNEEKIKQKEAQLLEMYEEIQKLKNNQ
jgi:hypothetical protein